MSDSDPSAARLHLGDLSGPDGSRTAVENLVTGYGEPAVFLSESGEDFTANRHAQTLRPLFEDGLKSELARLTNVARIKGQIVTATVMVSVDAGQVVYQVTIVPGVLGGGVLFLFHDQTLDHNLREALIESRQRFKDLVDISTDFAWEVGADGEFRYVSRGGALGYLATDLIGLNPRDLVIGAEEYDPFPFFADTVIEDAEVWMRTSTGTMSCVEVSAMPFYENDGTYLGMRGVCRDVTQERERASALAQAHQREQILGYIVNTIREEIDPLDMLGSAAAATARALGAQGASILRLHEQGRNNDKPQFVHAAQFGVSGPGQYADTFLSFAPGERLLHEDLVEGWRAMAAPCVHASNLKGVICLWRREEWSDDSRLLLSDIANQLGVAIAQIANHENIVRLSRTDAMTGLLNRRAFYDEELPRRFKRMEHNGATGALFYVDMDNFKLVNDVFGHQKGDDAIIALRDLLHDFVRPGDLIARLGGDEFALWLDGVDADTAAKRCRDLLKASDALKVFSGRPDRPLGISVGIAVYQPGVGEGLESLLARADGAMYDVKQNTKGDFRLASPYVPDREG